MPTQAVPATTTEVIDNPKYATISAVENGYVVRLNRRDSYREDTRVAATAEEALEACRVYFAA